MTKRIGLMMVIGIILVACQRSAAEPTPWFPPLIGQLSEEPQPESEAAELLRGVITHPIPTLSVDDTASARLPGCISSDLFGGLEPAYSVAKCTKSAQDLDNPDAECLTWRPTLGGGICYEAFVYRNASSGAVKATTQEELAELFAPIESADEALSYALLATHYRAHYALSDVDGPDLLECEKAGVRCPGKFVDTHVTEDSDGYLVNLYHYASDDYCMIETTTENHMICQVNSVVVRVDRDGNVAEQSSYRLCCCDC